jgi:hypothetical protein
MKLTQLFCSVSLVGCALFGPSLACAQYQWIDENGRMVFSDRPPPAAVNAAKVKATPVKVAAKPAEKSADPADGKTPAAGAAPNANLASQVVVPSAPKSLADKELESKKKALEAEEAAKKQKTDAERQAKLASACNETSGVIKGLETGGRASKFNAKGEREFISDEDRPKHIAALKKEFADNCSPK